MITVLTIIIIVLAIAIPIWDAMMNGTNLSAAQNQISAFLSGARADAIYNRQPIGVFFYIDPKSNQTAMAEVQVQTLFQPYLYPHPSGPPDPTYTSSFQPGQWTSSGGTFSWASWNAYPPTGGANPMPTSDNGPTSSIEMVNYPDPNNPGVPNVSPPGFIFYRDVIILPKGVGVAFNNNTYTYNQQNLWNYPTSYTINPQAAATYLPNNLPPLDRYLRIGLIMFNPDGTLATIHYGIPYYEALTFAQYTLVSNNTISPSENLLCKNMGMYASPPTDFASNTSYSPPSAATANPPNLPLISSVGFVIYDRDVYLNQHAGPKTVMDNTTPSSPTQTQIGDGAQFSELDMNCSRSNAPGTTYGSSSTFPPDKFIEESWIDQNGSAFLVTPVNGSLIKAK